MGIFLASLLHFSNASMYTHDKEPSKVILLNLGYGDLSAGEYCTTHILLNNSRAKHRVQIKELHDSDKKNI